MKEQIIQYTSENGNTCWFTQDFLDWFEDYWNDKKKAIKQWMRDNDCLCYLDHNIDGMPIWITAKEEDIYTPEEMAVRHFQFMLNNSVVEPTVKITVELPKYRFLQSKKN